jgi:signal transduction histidine kinase/FixJ family two-component response regulator
VIPDDLIHILKDVSDQILNAKDPEGLAKAAHQIVERFVPVPYSGIYLWIPSENKIKLLYSVGFTKEEDEINERTAMERHPGHVFKTREILYVTDMYAEEIPEYVRDVDRKKEVRSRLWMPICTDTKSLGSFGFASDKVDFFTQVHRDVLDYICRLVANQYVKMLQTEAEAEYAKKLSEAYTKVNEAFRVQNQFTAKMNHELRTPLNSILGLLRILENTQLQQDQKENITLIREQSQVLLSLVNDVLDISKIQEKEFKVVSFDMNLDSLIKDIVRVNTFNAKNKGIDFIYRTASDLPVFIQSDELRIRQILNNLLSNALKFTSKGNVTLSVEKKQKFDQSYLNFVVSDTGMGIPEEKIPHVFDRFYQVSDDIEISYGGSGLGLTIVKEIVDRMNGFIEVQSEIGKGTKFSVSIPMKIPDEVVSLKILEKEHIDLEGRKILIVDDNAINCHFLQHIIKEKGGQSEIATDGENAIELLKNDSDYDLILMDIRMPHMDGIECTKSVRNELKLSIPIIVQSGNTIERDIEQCYSAGANDFVSKPIDETDLFRKIVKNSIIKVPRSKSMNVPAIELNRELKKLFQHALTDFLIKVSSALKDDTLETIQFELHKFKSSLKQLGYDQLSDKSAYLENAIASDQFGETQIIALQALLDDLKELQESFD